jgi:hypothetical protein
VDLTPEPGISIGVNARGRPACVSHCNRDYAPIVSPAEASTAALDPIGGPAKSCSATNFGFLPSGCSPGVNCEGVRYLELSVYSVNPIPDGGTLFTCTIDVAGGLAAGTYPIVCSDPATADAEGMRVPTTCRDGAVAVSCPGDCNGNGRASVQEVVLGFSILTGKATLERCRALDTNADDSVSVAEFVRGYRSLVDGCAGSE